MVVVVVVVRAKTMSKSSERSVFDTESFDVGDMSCGGVRAKKKKKKNFVCRFCFVSLFFPLSFVDFVVLAVVCVEKNSETCVLVCDETTNKKGLPR